MHIPDGYLGPATYLSSYAACVPLWGTAARKVKIGLTARRVPLLAISAAFTFVVMMFNVPLPGATTGHAVGGVLIAIAVGPWGAAMAISIALAIQALLFGDGGITAIGANCLNMAFVMPFTGYAVYRWLARGFPSPKGQAIAAGIGGWAGLTCAAFTAAVLLGIQPLLHTAGGGRALYAPYPLSVTVPVMVLEHLLLFGVVEALLTGLAVYHLHGSRSAWILQAAEGRVPMKEYRAFWIALLALALVSPLGLYLPELMRAGTAWGEWSLEEIRQMVGYVPAGMQQLNDVWKALLPDYALPGQDGAPLAHRSLAYILSALLGIGLCGAATYILTRRLTKKSR
ncbi:MAG TPA: cobalt transporter CbiM [Candidatus Methylomirabilis sp.]